MIGIAEIEKIAQAVARYIGPRIENSLWGSTQVAHFLDVPKRTVTEKLALLPGFPPAIRFPTAGIGLGHPRWPESDVRAWAKKYQQKRCGGTHKAK